MRPITSTLKFPRAIGHRGLAARAPENTLAGMRCAKDHQFAWVEFDVQLTRDGAPIILHDATVERTTSGSGFARNFTLNEIRRFDAGSWFAEEFKNERIPTLEEVLALCETLRLGANVEIKVDPSETKAQIRQLVEASLACIKAQDTALPLVISSMSEYAIELCAEKAPQLPRGYLIDAAPTDLEALLQRMDQLNCVSFHGPVSAMTRELIDAVHASERSVLAFTIKKPEVATELFTLGVDSVFSDVPIADAALVITQAK